MVQPLVWARMCTYFFRLQKLKSLSLFSFFLILIGYCSITRALVGWRMEQVFTCLRNHTHTCVSCACCGFVWLAKHIPSRTIFGLECLLLHTGTKKLIILNWRKKHRVLQGFLVNKSTSFVISLMHSLFKI